MFQFLVEVVNPQCRDTSFLRTGNETFHANPCTVVVEPWRGRHHVYGVFMLPNEHQLNYPIMLTVKGAGSYRKEAHMVKINIEGYPVRSGHYLLQVNLKTRVALWMILRGLAYQLRQSPNWTLSYTQGVTQ
jgi:hypothetical protein